MTPDKGWWTTPTFSKPHRGAGLVFVVYIVLGFVVAALVLHSCQDADATVVGASGGNAVDNLEAQVGPLARHSYGQLRGTPVTDARYVNIAAGVPWAQVADGRYDTQLRRWADALAGKHRMVSFDHEPMTKPENGTATEFIKAYRHVANILQPAGVEMVWPVTRISMDKPRDSWDRPENFWPGRRWVDYVSSNVFNRAGCSERGWTSFRSDMLPLLALGERYNRPVVVSEFASTPSPDRARWLRNATRFLTRHTEVAAVYYFMGSHYDRCEFGLSTDGEYKAMAGMRKALR